MSAAAPCHTTTSVTSAMRFAKAAEELVGTPFRLHGRTPAAGVDCVGLVACALKHGGVPCGGAVDPPGGYGLRNRSIDRLLHLAADNGFAAIELSLSGAAICCWCALVRRNII